jgi:putative ABC transport system permease protein
MLTDLRAAVRSLGKSPGFSVLAIGILALGIGASTAIFSVVHAVLLKPLAYRDASRLIQVQASHPEQGQGNLAPATFIDLGRDSRSFAVLAAQTYNYVNLTKAASPARLTVVDATTDYFQLFGVAPLRGRTWTPAEAMAGAAPVAVLSESVWRTQFQAREDIIGSTIQLDDTAHTVIGVMPGTFTDVWGNGALWRPMALTGSALTDRNGRYLSTYARLAEGVSFEQAAAELTGLGRRLAQDFPQEYRDWSLVPADLQSLVVGDYRSGLIILLGGVGCVLVITCANVAGLAIVRAAGRRKELAVRAALGASGAQLLRQLLTESLLLALIGGALGVLLADWGVTAILNLIGDGWLPRAGEIAINGPVLAAALVVSLTTGIAFGLLPAWQASRTDANDALKEGGRGTAGPATRRIRSGLVVAEIALALVLLVGAGLLAKSFGTILQKSPGMRTSQLLALGVSLPQKRYPSVDVSRNFYLSVEEAVAALPGVTAVGFSQTMPFTWGIPNTLVPVGASRVSERNAPAAFYDSVGKDFFKAAGIPLVAGRLFAGNDDAKSTPVVIISQATARRFFGEENALGRRLRPVSQTQNVEFEIVGVVGDVLRTGLANTEVPLQIYRPIVQRPPAFATLIVQTSLPPESLAKTVQQAVWRIDPDQPLETVQPVSKLLANSVTQPRLYLTLFALFAGFAVLLAAVGLYGLIAYGVSQRTREFGIRAALGASPQAVLALVMREGLTLIVYGLVGGLAAAIIVARLMTQLLYGTSPWDPMVLAAVPLVLAGVSLAACLVPARRAARLNPLEALRAE